MCTRARRFVCMHTCMCLFEQPLPSLPSVLRLCRVTYCGGIVGFLCVYGLRNLYFIFLVIWVHGPRSIVRRFNAFNSMFRFGFFQRHACSTVFGRLFIHSWFYGSVFADCRSCCRCFCVIGGMAPTSRFKLVAQERQQAHILERTTFWGGFWLGP